MKPNLIQLLIYYFFKFSFIPSSLLKIILPLTIWSLSINYISTQPHSHPYPGSIIRPPGCVSSIISPLFPRNLNCNIMSYSPPSISSPPSFFSTQPSTQPSTCSCSGLSRTNPGPSHIHTHTSTYIPTPLSTDTNTNTNTNPARSRSSISISCSNQLSYRSSANISSIPPSININPASTALESTREGQL